MEKTCFRVDLSHAVDDFYTQVWPAKTTFSVGPSANCSTLDVLTDIFSIEICTLAR